METLQPKVEWSKGDNEIHGQQMQVNPALDTYLIKLMFQPAEEIAFVPAVVCARLGYLNVG